MHEYDLKGRSQYIWLVHNGNFIHLRPSVVLLFGENRNFMWNYLRLNFIREYTARRMFTLIRSLYCYDTILIRECLWNLSKMPNIFPCIYTIMVMVRYRVGVHRGSHNVSNPFRLGLRGRHMGKLYCLGNHEECLKMHRSQTAGDQNMKSPTYILPSVLVYSWEVSSL